MKSYDKKQELKHIRYLDANNVHGYAISKYLSTSKMEWTDPKNFNSNKYSSNSSKGCVIEIYVEYAKELRELPSDYPLAQGKKEIKREISSNYHLSIVKVYNIPIGNVKKLVPNIFDR